LFLCGCTFGLHLASTVSTPILAIYGPTSEKEWAPYDNCTVINHKLPCSPCVYIGSTFHCQLDKKCLRDITVDEVFETTINILNKENYQQNLG
jgi:heptosyltransferase-2